MLLENQKSNVFVGGEKLSAARRKTERSVCHFCPWMRVGGTRRMHAGQMGNVVSQKKQTNGKNKDAQHPWVNERSQPLRYSRSISEADGRMGGARTTGGRRCPRVVMFGDGWRQPNELLCFAML